MTVAPFARQPGAAAQSPCAACRQASNAPRRPRPPPCLCAPHPLRRARACTADPRSPPETGADANAGPSLRAPTPTPPAPTPGPRLPASRALPRRPHQLRRRRRTPTLPTDADPNADPPGANPNADSAGANPRAPTRAPPPIPPPPPPRALAALEVSPPDVTLVTNRSKQLFIVQATFADGLTRDVTAEAKATLANPTLAKLDKNLLTPLADGATTLAVEFGGKTVGVPVTVKDAAKDRPISFKLDVMPVFMRAGCNAGSCHGAARGKDGFRLSLFGFDADGDATTASPAWR